MRDTTQVAQPIAASSKLPSQYPQPPEQLLRAFPEFAAYHNQLERIYKSIREAMQSANDSVATATTQQQTNLSNWYRDSAGRLVTKLDVVGETISAKAFEGGAVSGTDAQFSGDTEVAGETTLMGDVWVATRLRKPDESGWSVVLMAGADEIAIRRDAGTGKIHFRINEADVGGFIPS